jgi:hypothetical protein
MSLQNCARIIPPEQNKRMREHLARKRTESGHADR